MPKKPRKLSDIRPAQRAAQGSNTRRWFMIEHQLYQAQISLQAVRSQCEKIGDEPENQEEWELARALLEVISPVYVSLLGAIATQRSLLSGSEVAERVGRTEGA